MLLTWEVAVIWRSDKEDCGYQRNRQRQFNYNATRTGSGAGAQIEPVMIAESDATLVVRPWSGGGIVSASSLTVTLNGQTDPLEHLRISDVSISLSPLEAGEHNTDYNYFSGRVITATSWRISLEGNTLKRTLRSHISMLFETSLEAEECFQLIKMLGGSETIQNALCEQDFSEVPLRHPLTIFKEVSQLFFQSSLDISHGNLPTSSHQEPRYCTRISEVIIDPSLDIRFTGSTQNSAVKPDADFTRTNTVPRSILSGNNLAEREDVTKDSAAKLHAIMERGTDLTRTGTVPFPVMSDNNAAAGRDVRKGLAANLDESSQYRYVYSRRSKTVPKTIASNLPRTDPEGGNEKLTASSRVDNLNIGDYINMIIGAAPKSGSNSALCPTETSSRAPELSSKVPVKLVTSSETHPDCFTQLSERCSKCFSQVSSEAHPERFSQLSWQVPVQPKEESETRPGCVSVSSRDTLRKIWPASSEEKPRCFSDMPTPNQPRAEYSTASTKTFPLPSSSQAQPLCCTQVSETKVVSSGDKNLDPELGNDTGVARQNAGTNGEVKLDSLSQLCAEHSTSTTSIEDFSILGSSQKESLYCTQISGVAAFSSLKKHFKANIPEPAMKARASSSRKEILHAQAMSESTFAVRADVTTDLDVAQVNLDSRSQLCGEHSTTTDEGVPMPRSSEKETRHCTQIHQMAVVQFVEEKIGKNLESAMKPGVNPPQASTILRPDPHLSENSVASPARRDRGGDEGTNREIILNSLSQSLAERSITSSAALSIPRATPPRSIREKPRLCAQVSEIVTVSSSDDHLSENNVVSILNPEAKSTQACNFSDSVLSEKIVSARGDVVTNVEENLVSPCQVWSDYSTAAAFPMTQKHLSGFTEETNFELANELLKEPSRVHKSKLSTSVKALKLARDTRKRPRKLKPVRAAPCTKIGHQDMRKSSLLEEISRNVSVPVEILFNARTSIYSQPQSTSASGGSWPPRFSQLLRESQESQEEAPTPNEADLLDLNHTMVA